METKKHQKPTLRQRIAHALTDRKILHFRYDAHLRQQVYKRLNTLQKSLINRISAIGIEGLSAKKLDKLLTELQTEIAKTYQETTAYTQDELSGFLSLEASKISQLYNDEIGFDLFNDVPKERIKAIKNVAVIEGQPLEAWWNKQRADLAFKFEGIIRTGVAEGKQNGQLATEVRELMNISRRNAETLVITAVAKVADTAHEELRDANLDILSGEEHLSTLDMRTSTVCQVRDGKRWDLDKKPIGHNIPYKRPPLHPRCRSILQLVTKSWEELGVQGMDEMPTSTRASMNGQVDERINYESWLHSKTHEEKEKVLGKGKADLWERGVITFSDMLDQSGRPLTLRDLQDQAEIPKAIRVIRRAHWSEEFKAKTEKIYYDFANEGIIIDHHGLGRLGERLVKAKLTVVEAIQIVKNTPINYIDKRNGRYVRFNQERKVAIIQSNIDDQIITFERKTTPNLDNWKPYE